MRVLVSLELLLRSEAPAATLMCALVRFRSFRHMCKSMIAEQVGLWECRATCFTLKSQLLLPINCTDQLTLCDSALSCTSRCRRKWAAVQKRLSHPSLSHENAFSSADRCVRRCVLR